MAAVFIYTPDFDAEKAKNPNVSNVKFGDGYEQRVTKGINGSPEVWNLIFANRNESETNAIDIFLEDLNGVTPFLWTPPGSMEQKVYKCQQWNVRVVKYNLFTITAVFEQVFEPV